MLARPRAITQYDTMDWKEQMKAVSSKVSRAVGVLKHAKYFSRERNVADSTEALWSPTFDTAVLSGAASV